MDVRILHTRVLSPLQLEQIDELWNRNYPVNLKDRFRLLLVETTHQNHYLLLNCNNKLLGWAMDFERDDEIWFSIIVDKAEQGKGYGKQLVDSLKEKNSIINGWVIDTDTDLLHDGSNYISPLPFYQQQGFVVHTDKRIDTPIISAVKVSWQKNK